MDESEKPSLSVVVPIHNRVWALPRALRSVLRQQLGDIEVVVVDDGSAENVEGVLSSLDDPRVTYLRQSHQGANAARNLGARHATAPWLTFLDADDEVLAGWATALVEEFDAGADIVCCGFESRHPDGRTTTHLPGELGGPLGNVHGMFSHAGTYSLSKEIFAAVGGYAPNLRAAQHTDFAYRVVPLALSRGWAIRTVQKALMRYHAQSPGGIRRNHEAVLEGAEYILKTHGDLLRAHPSERANYHATAGYRAFRLKQYERARAHFRTAAVAQPRKLRHWARYCLALVPTVGQRVWKVGSEEEATS